MNITTNNNGSINFNGAFLIKSFSPQAQMELLKLIPKKKILFDNFQKEGNVLFVTKPSKDILAADFIKGNHLKFKYYPALSTKSGFVENHPDEAAKILKSNKDNVITTLKDMFKYLTPKPKAKKAPKDRRDILEHVFKALELDQSDVIIKKTNGYTLLTDKTGRPMARISPQGRFGTNFVLVEGKNSDESSKRYAIDEAGNIIAKYSSFKGFKQFRKNFAAAVHFNKDKI